MSVDILSMTGGAHPANPAVSARVAGRGASKGAGDGGESAPDFAAIIEGKSTDAEPPAIAVGRNGRSKAAKNGAKPLEENGVSASVMSGMETAPTGMNVVKGGSSEQNGNGGTKRDKRLSVDGQEQGSVPVGPGLSVESVATPVSITHNVPNAAHAGEGKVGEAEAGALAADMRSKALTGVPRGDQAIAQVSNADLLTDEAAVRDVKASLPSGADRLAQDKGESPVSPASAQLLTASSSTIEVSGKTPVRAGEATALLDMVAQGLVSETEDAAQVIQQRARGADIANDAAQSQGAVPKDGGMRADLREDVGGKISGLVAMASQKMAEPAAPVVEGVIEKRAVKVEGELPEVERSASGQSPTQTSTLAIAAAQSAGKPRGVTTQQAKDEGLAPASKAAALEGRGDVTLSSDASPIGGRGDAGNAQPPSFPLSSTTMMFGVTDVSGSSVVASNVGASLDQQVVDMGVSGQWIDDISREIATMARNPGQGSFRMASPELGTVRVDIAPGSRGTDVQMTVDNDAALLALTKDQTRLMQDAQLASVRLGDIRIDRVAPAAEAQRGDMGGGSQQQAGGQGQAGAQMAFGQGNGQNGGQPSARPDMMGFGSDRSGENNPKASFTRTVINDAAVAEPTTLTRKGSAETARYA